jgi:hypothetical protein
MLGGEINQLKFCKFFLISGFGPMADMNRVCYLLPHQMLFGGGNPMISAGQPSAADAPSEVADNANEAALAQVMHVVPLGAGVLAGAAVALLVLGYLAIYLLIFLPRGAVG